MFSSRLLVGLLIILVILGLGMWFSSTANVDTASVQVAGALVSSSDVDLSVRDCYIAEGENGRQLVVELEAKNAGGYEVELNPREFQLILVDAENTAMPIGPRNTFRPMRFTSTCEEAAYSISRIPPDSVRFYSLCFWGETLPRGEEWEEHYLSLEYYDPFTPLMLSKALNPEER